MRTSTSYVNLFLFFVGLGAGALGCASEPEPARSGCADDRSIGGACAGVPAGAVCDGDACTEGVSCAEVVHVASDAELQQAAAGASSGACIAIGPGAYGDVALPGGVSLLGRGAELVTVRGLSLGAGEGAVARGVAVGEGGVRLESGGSARIEAVRVVGSGADGVAVGAGASLEIADSSVEGATGYGVSAIDAASLSVSGTFITGARGPGLWAECTGGCACDTPVALRLENTILRDSKVVGVSLRGVRATLTSVEISGNTANGFDPSGGLSAAICSSLTSTSLRVAENSGYGVLIDGASAEMDGDGFEVTGSSPGIWIQHTTADQAVRLAGVVLDHNRGVGIGMSGEARGIIIDGARIAGTLADSVAVNAGGVLGRAVVGDAVSWQERAQATLSGLVLSGNNLASANPSFPPASRASVLIDGAVGPSSSLERVTLEGGDEATGIVQQHLDAAAETPQRGADVPPITTSATELFSVPLPPAAPAAP